MGKFKFISRRYGRSDFVNGLIGIYFFMAFIEMLGEYYLNTFFVFISKPLLIPFLTIMYIVKKRKHNLIYIIVLGLAWLSNVFLMFNLYRIIVFGYFFSFVFYFFVFILIYRLLKFPGNNLFIVCCVPFVLVYLYFINKVNIDSKVIYYLFIFQSIFTVLIGGYSLSIYIEYPNRSNTLLFLSVILFAISQLIFVLKARMPLQFIRPIETVFYVFAQYFLYNFVIFEERRKRYYEIKNESMKTEL